MIEYSDVRLFEAFIQAAKYMRSGRPSGAIPGDCAPGIGHCFRRETILPILLDDDSVKPTMLAKQLRVSPSTLSEMLNRLEADGYIRRGRDPDDRRAAVLTLTERGKARAEELKEEGDRMFSYLFRNLSEDDKAELIRLLEKMADV